ncbi:MAG: DEAD/DEAH box helicase, partial [Planctomycetota bacterium]|nr:DEAD/DEAH box helicase [Planctomycetota bacterium]
MFAGRIKVLREFDRPVRIPEPVAASAAPAKSKVGPGIRGMLKRKKGDDAETLPAVATPRSASPPRPKRIVVTSIAALLQPVPDRAELERATRTLKVGDTLEPEDLVRWLIDRGFSRVPAIELPGEFCVHGGIVDVFPFAETDPVRIEFFGDQIESLRRFDVETQRKIEDLKSLSMLVAGRKKLDEPVEEEASEDDDEALIALANFARRRSAPPPAAVTGEAHTADWLPSGSWVALVDLVELTNEGRQYLQRLANPRGYYTVDATLARLNRLPIVTVSGISEHGYETACHLRVESVERFQAPAAEIVAELDQLVAADERVLLACHNAGEKHRVTELFAASKLTQHGRLRVCEGRLVRGFRLVDERLIVLSDHELFHRREVRRTTRKQTASTAARAIDSFLELKEGDLVVHLMKGIARYRGMQMLSKDDQQEEHLVLEFKEGARVYVPVSLIHLVQKYVGGAKSAPTLSPLTGTSWEKKKQAAAAAIADLAGDMLALQAARDSKPGIASPPDSHWQRESMDRLICGDVGYGKTEVAMRAAFKAIDSGRQVAVLVPTTVLAEQHYRTFSERMAEFPFQIDVLSRFRTKKEQRGVLERLETGTIDLVVGTHRIVSPDVKFSDLGLLIIDEEQRFGVEAKEMLKKLRLEVDVLTLTATPIPRTLHLSLLGLRDISNLQTPPQDRVAVETR